MLLVTYQELRSLVQTEGQGCSLTVVLLRGPMGVSEFVPWVMIFVAVLWPSVAMGRMLGCVQGVTVPGVAWVKSGKNAVGNLMVHTVGSLIAGRVCYCASNCHFL